MERALEAARANHAEDDPLLTGMQLVHDNCWHRWSGIRAETIEAAGKPFDPDLHAALMQQPTAEHPPGTVLQELRRATAQGPDDPPGRCGGLQVARPKPASSPSEEGDDADV